MVRKLLIDAAHMEEMRAVVFDGRFIEEFEYESQATAQIKGNIYLGVISRIEPSLQAAFVDYGGKKHGFLPFSEIHPDYYHIDDSVRQRIKEDMQQERDNSQEDDEDDVYYDDGDGQNITEVIDGNEYAVQRINDEQGAARADRSYRDYRIQDVIKRNSVVLVQVVKDERGSKGVTLTTYISLVGRYCVLMPNTDRNGGISHRINTAPDRLRLKVVLDGLNVVEGGSVIIRTAGANKELKDIKYDYEYLLGLWRGICTHATAATAPSFVYMESSLLKRFLRDFYDDSMSEVIIEGREAFELARQIAKKMVPSALPKLRLHNHVEPLFCRHDIEKQIAELYSNVAYLKSGGYIVINQTEALVSIDVNSGRMTSERDIRETALKTNLEAAKEIARHIRIRDLSGLLIIDFIDMHEYKHRRQTENAMRDELKSDRAKIQIGRISAFGLMEMSRQRLGSSFLANNTVQCSHCKGNGYMRNPISTVMAILRAIDRDVRRHREQCKSNSSVAAINVCYVYGNSDVILCLLNKARNKLLEIEERFNIRINSAVEPSYECGLFSIKCAYEEDVFADIIGGKSTLSISPGSTARDVFYEESCLIKEGKKSAKHNKPKRKGPHRRDEPNKGSVPTTRDGGHRKVGNIDRSRRRGRSNFSANDDVEPINNNDPQYSIPEDTSNLPVGQSNNSTNNSLGGDATNKAADQVKKDVSKDSAKDGDRRGRVARHNNRRAKGRNTSADNASNIENSSESSLDKVQASSKTNNVVDKDKAAVSTNKAVNELSGGEVVSVADSSVEKSKTTNTRRRKTTNRNSQNTSQNANAQKDKDSVVANDKSKKVDVGDDKDVGPDKQSSSAANKRSGAAHKRSGGGAARKKKGVSEAKDGDNKDSEAPKA